MNLKISIITASYNRANLLETCIKSVLLQNYDNFEHIIVDGGSTDSTMDLLKNYLHLRILSELDDGIYDAWNKGLKLATGDIIVIMNSDDFFGENIFHHINNIFQSQKEIQLITGKALQVCYKRETNEWNVICKYEEQPSNRLSLKNLTIMGPFINARFFRKSFLDQIGFFSLDYRSASDVDFMIRVALKNPEILYIDRYFCYYLSHNSSLTMDMEQSNILSVYLEKLKCLNYCILNYKMNNVEKKILQRIYAFQCAIGSIYMILKKMDIRNGYLFFCKGMRYPFSYFWFFLKDIVQGMTLKIKQILRIKSYHNNDVLPAHLINGIISFD